MSVYIKNLIEERPANDSFKYMLLGRMQSDCNFYLGDSSQSHNAKYLWAGDEKEHIENMKALWDSFPEDEKPAWLTMEQIEEYEMNMCN